VKHDGDGEEAPEQGVVMDAGSERIHRNIAERVIKEMADQIGEQHQPADQADLPKTDAADQSSQPPHDHSSPSRLRSRSFARSASAGCGNAANGSGRVTSIAASPSRADKRPVRMPSPSRCDNFAAMPWPSTCWTRLSLAAMPPVIAACAMT